MQATQKRILSGMRPTGQLHLGHYLGVLQNWVRFQQDYECFFMLADWHALMSEYRNSHRIQESLIDNVADWIACGVDPENCSVFVQSDVAEHTELAMILATICPIPWLERCPTYKEQLQQLKEKDIFTYAFLGYPVLQTADIALYRADYVPVGKDQLPHLELGREIIRRFHHIFRCDIFPEPEPLLDSESKILGTDGRKMSKSYGNHIALGDSPDEIRSKILSMLTDEQRVRKTDPGRPDICNVFSYYQIFEPSQAQAVRAWCEGATKGCRDCKSQLADAVIETLRPIRSKKEQLLSDKIYLKNILKQGAQKASAEAQSTIAAVRQAIGL